MMSVRCAFKLIRVQFSALRRDERGATLVEFAFVFPVFLLAVVGTIEIAMVIFLNSSIEAAIMEASRYGITGGTIPGVTRQDRVLEIVSDKTYGFVDMNQVELTTLVYGTFDDIGKPEPYEDINENVQYDVAEPFTDVNGNGEWDADMGAAGLGGPSDVVVYSIGYTWGIMTPFIRNAIAESATFISSVAVRNEPF